MTRSLQSTLMTWMGATIAAVLLGAGSGIYLFVQRALQNEFDLGLKQTCHSVAHLVELDRGQIESEMAENELPGFARSQRPDLYELLDSDGMRVDSSSRLGASSLPPAGAQLDRVVFESVQLPDGRPGRSASFKFLPRIDTDFDGHEELQPAGHGAQADPRDTDHINEQDGSVVVKPLTLVVARDTIELDRTLSKIRWLIGIVTAVAIGTGILLSALVARLGLSSLRTTTEKICAIDGTNLDVPVGEEKAPSEVEPLMTALAGMQDRLKLAFDRERQFSANVAHELRTPLAGLKGMLEVTITKKRTPEEYEESLRKCGSACDQTEAIVDNLFTLALVDSGQCPLDRENIDLSHFIRAAWQPFARLAEQRGLTPKWELDESLQMHTDKIKLALLLRNLFENAVIYSVPESQLEICCHRTAEAERRSVGIQIVNSASQLTHADIPRMFDRFWRGDESRSQTGHHSGLGLSLCHSLAELLGGSISARLTCSERIAILVTLPST